MFNSSATKAIGFSLLIITSGCATGGSTSAKPDNDSASSSQPPRNIIEAASKFASTPLFDSGTYKRLQAASLSSPDKAVIQKNIRAAICDGMRPRVLPKFIVRLVLNKPTPGAPLDLIAERERLFIDQTALYLKHFWFDEASPVSALTYHNDHDFDEYLKASTVPDETRNRSGRSITVGIPFLPQSLAEGAELYFAAAHATPNLKRMNVTGPAEWYPARSYLAVIFPKTHVIIMSSKVADMVIAQWPEGQDKTKITYSPVNDVQLELGTSIGTFGGGHGFHLRNESQYTLSEDSWTLPNGTIVHPLIAAVEDDLAFLKQQFSWQIPKADVIRLFGSGKLTLQTFGYDYDTGRYSAALALQNKGVIWSRILANQTEVKSAAQDDGSITNSIELNLNAFCAWAIQTSALTAQ